MTTRTSPAVRRFREFIHGLQRLDPSITLTRIADDCQTSKTALIGYMKGELCPREEQRAIFEVYTGGQIKVPEWRTTKERRRLEKVRPSPFAASVQV